MDLPKFINWFGLSLIVGISAVKAIGHFPVRYPSLNFENECSPYYIKDNFYASHVMSSLNISFLESEPFTIRSVHPYIKNIDDPALKIDAKNFCGQENQHQKQVQHFITFLENKGYDLKSWLKFINWHFRKFLSKLPSSIKLSITAGLEHQTAAFSYVGLKYKILDLMDPSHDTMRKFLLWHAVEELEHRYVSFEILQNAYPKNYPLRFLGFVISFAEVSWYGWYGVFKLTFQDLRQGRLNIKRIFRDIKFVLFNRQMRKLMTEYYILAFKYLLPGFHPNQIKDQDLLPHFRKELRQFVT